MPLFLRIFLGFWLVTAAVLGSWLLAGNYLDTLLTGGEPPRERDGPPRFVMQLLYDLQNQPLESLAETVAVAEDKRELTLFLLDAGLRDVLGRDLPPAVREIAARLEHDGQRRAFLRDGRHHLVAHNLHRSDAGQMRVVLRFAPSRSWLARTLGSHLWLRLTVALLVSGLLCYALSRLFTRRLEHLRAAARQLASGKLDTRLSVRQRGGDETDELARDFNAMAAQLQARIAAERQLLSDVSHELRSPLARLRVALALAQQQPAHAAADWSRLEREVQRLDELIDELLHSQHNAVTLEEHIDLDALLRELSEDAAFEGSQRQRRVSYQGAGQDILILGNSTLLRRAFDNLLRNALAYTAEGTEVTIRLQACSADTALVTVEDRGPGVPAADLERIFAPFYRVDSARTRETGGNGLGLAIARRAIEAHGGTLRAENTGSGLRLRTELPRYCD